MCNKLKKFWFEEKLFGEKNVKIVFFTKKDWNIIFLPDFFHMHGQFNARNAKNTKGFKFMEKRVLRNFLKNCIFFKQFTTF